MLRILFLFFCVCSFAVSATSIEKTSQELKSQTQIKVDNNDGGEIDSDLNMQESLGNSVIDLSGYKIKIQGFFSAAGAISNAKRVASLTTPGNFEVPNYQGIVEHFTFESDSLAGLQMTAPVTEQANLVLQIVARGRPRDALTNKYELNATWAYLDYEVQDNLSLKAGRILIPIFMLSQYVDVAYGYPWIKPPQEIYAFSPLPSFNGVSANWLINITDDWQLELEPFFVANSGVISFFGMNIPVNLKNITGLGANISNDWFNLSAVYVHANYVINNGNPLSLGFPSVPANTLPALDRPLTFSRVGLHIEKNNILILSEYAIRKMDGGYMPDAYSWYVLGGYQVDKIMPWVSYAQSHNFNKNKILTLDPALQGSLTTAFIQEQTSLAAGLRYDLATNMALKISVTHITPLNGSRGFFNIKPNQRSVNIYNAGINLVF